jgi:hypothetical protein
VFINHAELGHYIPLKTFRGRMEVALRFQKKQWEVLFAERQCSKEFSEDPGT